MRILPRLGLLLVVVLVLVAGLTIGASPRATAHAGTSASPGGAQPFEVWCC